MKEYTAKQIKELKANPYTLKVTKNKLYFTIKFKEDFWKLPLNTRSGVNNELPVLLKIKTEFSTAAHIGPRLIFVYEPETQL